MKQYFDKELIGEVTSENIDKRLGSSIYGSNYQIGDKVYYFLEQEIKDKSNTEECTSIPIEGVNIEEEKKDYNHLTALLTVRVLLERDFKRFEQDYEFVRYVSKTPIFKKK